MRVGSDQRSRGSQSALALAPGLICQRSTKPSRRPAAGGSPRGHQGKKISPSILEAISSSTRRHSLRALLFASSLRLRAWQTTPYPRTSCAWPQVERRPGAEILTVWLRVSRRYMHPSHFFFFSLFLFADRPFSIGAPAHRGLLVRAHASSRSTGTPYLTSALPPRTQSTGPRGTCDLDRLRAMMVSGAVTGSGMCESTAKEPQPGPPSPLRSAGVWSPSHELRFTATFHASRQPALMDLRGIRWKDSCRMRR